MAPPDPSAIDWAAIIDAPSYQNKLSSDYKSQLALSLMIYLGLTPRVWMDWFVGSEDPQVKKRAGHYLAPSSGAMQSLLHSVWTRFKGARSGVIAAIEPIVQELLERESKAAINCRELSIRPGDIDLDTLVAKLGHGEDGIASCIQTLMPLSFKWLLHATSSENEYRRKLRLEQSRTASALPTAESNDHDEGAAFPLHGEEWHTAYPGFSRDPRLVRISVVALTCG